MKNFNQINKERKKEAARQLKTLSPEFMETDLLAMRRDPEVSIFVPTWLTRSFRNNEFTVMIQDNCQTTHGLAIRVMIQKHSNTPIVNHWKTMQRIKNEIFGEETCAVEYYPPQSKLIDEYNIYWMFIYPKGVIPEYIEPIHKIGL